MRSVLTFLLSLLFSAGFFAFFAVSGVLTYARDTPAVVDTARAADLHARAVALVTETIHDELRRDPRLAGVQRPQIAFVVGQVLSVDWFESTLRATHASLVAAVDGAASTAVIDLEPTKQHLASAFRALGARAGAECAQILGAGACHSSADARRAMDAYQIGVRAAIARIPAQIDLVAAVQAVLRASGQAARVERVVSTGELRRRLGDLRTLRWIGLGVLGLCLLLIAALNSTPLARMMRATGAAVLGAAAVYLAVAKLVAWAGPDLVAGKITELQARHAGAGKTGQIAVEGMLRLFTEMIARTLDASASVVILCAVAGAALLLASLLFSREP